MPQITPRPPRLNTGRKVPAAERLARIDTAVEIEDLMRAKGITHAAMAARCNLSEAAITRALADPESRTSDWWRKVRAEI